jgi:ligand-binding sensor domain-containing protein
MIIGILFLLAAQDWQSYTNTDVVHDLLTDGTQMYCATQGGLSIFSLTANKFDTTFTNAAGLPVNQCHCLAFDKNRTLWIGTQGGGLSTFTPATENFSTYPYNQLPESDIKTIAAAGDTMLVGSANGLYVILPNQPPLRFTQLQGLISNNILCLGIGKYFWVGTDKGISRITRSPLRVDSSFSRASGLGGDSAMAICVTETVTAKTVVSTVKTTASVVIATESGIAIFTNGKFDTVVQFPSKMAIRDLVERGDTFYLATDKGGFRYQPAAGLEPVVLPSNDVRSLLVQDGIWFGLGGNEYNGYGLYHYYRNSAARDTLTAFPADCIHSNSVEDVVTDTAGGIWACHGWPPHRQGISYHDPSGHWHYFKNWPWAGMRLAGRDSKNRLWFGCWWAGDQHWSADSVAGVCRFSPADSTWRFYNWGNYSPMNVIGALAIDAYDRVWVCHFNQEVVSAIDTTGELITIASSAPLFNARGIAFDSQNRVWIASRGGGLIMIDHKNTLTNTADDQLRIFTTADGLPSLEVTSVSVDPQDRVWFGTDKGLGLFDADRFHLYTGSNTNNGLSADYVIRVKTDHWGDVWCLTTAGLSVYHPFENRWTSYLSQNSGLIPQANFVNDYTGLWIDENRGMAFIGSKNGGVSQFRFQKPPVADLDSVSIHPNPFIPSSGHQRIIFDRLPNNALVRIYTLAGELIATIKADPNHRAQAWQPLPRIASGLYVAVISTPQTRRIKKIAIVK